jgi:aspartyl-tRNA(Asn)/glutamyl-tRNA(Gln) amidotransferase subunit C
MTEKKFDIDNLAKLARINLSDSEKSKLEGHLGQILEYVELLSQIDTSEVEPTSHVLPLQNVCREDKVKPKDETANYLELAPRKDKGHYEVPQIIS